MGYVHERHPGLCEAAYQLTAAVHEEKNPKVDADAPTPFSFNMDEMSDDDDDEDMETGEVSRQRPGGRGSFGESAPITADQLASAIASAQNAGYANTIFTRNGWNDRIYK